MHDSEHLVAELERIAAVDLGDDWVATLRDRVRATRDGHKARIAFIGAFNAGKSSLIDAVLGEPVLPRDATPTTAAIAEVLRGPMLRFVRVDEIDGRDIETPIDAQTFAAEARRSSAEVRRLRAYCPGVSVPDDVMLCDTPGVDSLDAAHAEVTYSYLPTVDGVVVVVDGERGLTQSDETFLRSALLEHTRARMVVVVTHLDAKTPADRATIVDSVRAAVERAAIDAPVIGANPAGALESPPTASVDDVRALLDERFYRNVRALREEQAHRMALAGATEASTKLRELARALALTDPELERQAAAAEELRRTVVDERSSLHVELGTRRRRLLTDLEARLSKLRDRATARAEGYLAAARDLETEAPRVGARVTADLARDVEELYAGWLRPQLATYASDVQAAMGADRS